MVKWHEDDRGMYVRLCVRCLEEWDDPTQTCPHCGYIASFKEYQDERTIQLESDLTSTGYLEGLRQYYLDRLDLRASTSARNCEWCGLDAGREQGFCPRCRQMLPLPRLALRVPITGYLPKLDSSQLPF